MIVAFFIIASFPIEFSMTDTGQSRMNLFEIRWQFNIPLKFIYFKQFFISFFYEGEVNPVSFHSDIYVHLEYAEISLALFLGFCNLAGSY